MAEERDAVNEVIAHEVVCPTCGQCAERIPEDAHFWAHGLCKYCDHWFDLWDVDYAERDNMNVSVPDVSDDDDEYATWF